MELPGCSSSVCAAGSQHTVTFSGLVNPFTTEPLSGTLTVSTQLFDSGLSVYYNMDVLDIAIPADNSALATLTTNAATATVTRTTTKVSQETSIDLDMTFPTRMLDGSFI